MLMLIFTLLECLPITMSVLDYMLTMSMVGVRLYVANVNVSVGLYAHNVNGRRHMEGRVIWHPAWHPEWLLALKQLCGKNLVWFGLVFCIVWHGVTWYGMVKYGMEWYGMDARSFSFLPSTANGPQRHRDPPSSILLGFSSSRTLS